MVFRKKKPQPQVDKVEEIFLTVADMTKNLSKKELSRLIEGIELTWEAWQKVSQAQTTQDREMAEIDRAEKYLEVPQ